MKADYKRDLNRNYMVLNDLSDGFQTDMLLKNKSDCFIPLKKVLWDGKTLLYYDITGKQTLEKGFAKRKITYNELSDILYSISISVKECKRLFLDISGIVLKPEYIFRDLATDRIQWIFYPCESEERDIMELAEFLLEHIDNSNPGVVKTTYELYRLAKEGSIQAENLYEILHSDLDCEEEAYEESPTASAKPAFSDNKKAKEKYDGAEGGNKVDKIVDRLFKLMKKKEPDNRVSDPQYTDYSPVEDNKLNEIEDNSYGQTTLLSLPAGNTRRLISRDTKIPDANLEVFPCVLGSKRDCVDVLLSDNSVSRMHAQIDESQGRLYIYDLSSTNGTYVNGCKIVDEEKEITSGDEIQLGSLRFVLA